MGAAAIAKHIGVLCLARLCCTSLPLPFNAAHNTSLQMGLIYLWDFLHLGYSWVETTQILCMDSK